MQELCSLPQTPNDIKTQNNIPTTVSTYFETQNHTPTKKSSHSQLESRISTME